ncbi:hypothetical protein GGS23DRAFT_409813 [Durotheca rogersii]|uniref:uncharacterized protein n=1 Tax=Durotheca rogersii TaxID=419775 RepID=UPI00221ED804|nr:uncharacterized protein GGS23DRAFT_409813 [Durotheca rogersii]KAI5865111.1 hypothetical protein GGS23DRAFT_409813 [Durotheca rogersii]
MVAYCYSAAGCLVAARFPTILSRLFHPRLGRGALRDIPVICLAWPCPVLALPCSRSCPALAYPLLRLTSIRIALYASMLLCLFATWLSCLSTHPPTHTHAQPLTHSLTYSHTHTHTLTLTLSLSLSIPPLAWSLQHANAACWRRLCSSLPRRNEPETSTPGSPGRPSNEDYQGYVQLQTQSKEEKKTKNK